MRASCRTRALVGPEPSGARRDRPLGPQMLGKVKRAIARRKEGASPQKWRFDCRVTSLQGIPSLVSSCRIVWARGKKYQMTNATQAFDGQATWNQQLSHMVTMYTTKVREERSAWEGRRWRRGRGARRRARPRLFSVSSPPARPPRCRTASSSPRSTSSSSKSPRRTGSSSRLAKGRWTSRSSPRRGRGRRPSCPSRISTSSYAGRRTDDSASAVSGRQGDLEPAALQRASGLGTAPRGALPRAAPALGGARPRPRAFYCVEMRSCVADSCRGGAGAVSARTDVNGGAQRFPPRSASLRRARSDGAVHWGW